MKKLSGEALDEFIRRYEAVFGVRLTQEKADEMFAELMHLYRSLRRAAAARGSDCTDEGDRADGL